MKTIFTTLFTFLVLANVNAQNLISNSGFEEGKTGWNTWIADTGGKAEVTITDDAKTGSKALLAKIEKLNKEIWEINTGQKIATEAEEAYVLKFDAKADEDGKKLKIQFQNTTYTGQEFTLSTDWKSFEYTFVAKEDNLEAVFQFINTGTFTIDNVEITVAPEPNPLEGGDFEAGIDSWNNSFDNGANAIFTEENSDLPVPESKKALRALVLKLGGKPWNVASSKEFASKKNAKYLITFYGKSKKPGSKIRFQVQKGSESIYDGKDFIFSPKWTKYEWIYGAKADDMQVAIQYPNTDLYYIDEVKIKKLSKDKKKKKKKKKKK